MGKGLILTLGALGIISFAPISEPSAQELLSHQPSEVQGIATWEVN